MHLFRTDNFISPITYSDINCFKLLIQWRVRHNSVPVTYQGRPHANILMSGNFERMSSTRPFNPFGNLLGFASKSYSCLTPLVCCHPSSTMMPDNLTLDSCNSFKVEMTCECDKPLPVHSTCSTVVRHTIASCQISETPHR